MDPVGKALWLIETELAGNLDLQRIASQCGLSRFSLARAFACATGWPVMRYVRARRLRACEKTLAYCDRPQVPAADVALRKNRGHLAH